MTSDHDSPVPSVHLRPVGPGDFDGWSRLWAGYLDFYREPLGDGVSRATFDRLVAGGELFGFVAERDAGELVGFVHALCHPSTWTTGLYCYLEDLYVDPAARHSTLARELIEAVAAEAARRGAVKVYWQTHEYNGAARSLYDQVAHRISFVVYERPL